MAEKIEINEAAIHFAMFRLLGKGVTVANDRPIYETLVREVIQELISNGQSNSPYAAAITKAYQEGLDLLACRLVIVTADSIRGVF